MSTDNNDHYATSTPGRQQAMPIWHAVVDLKAMDRVGREAFKLPKSFVGRSVLAKSPNGRALR